MREQWASRVEVEVMLGSKRVGPLAFIDHIRLGRCATTEAKVEE